MEIAYWVIAALVLYGWVGNKRAGFLHFLLGVVAAAIWPVTIAGFVLFAGYVYLTSKGEIR